MYSEFGRACKLGTKAKFFWKETLPWVYASVQGDTADVRKKFETIFQKLYKFLASMEYLIKWGAKSWEH